MNASIGEVLLDVQEIKLSLEESLILGSVSFQVIGVLEPKMQEGDDDINRQIYIPFNTTSDLTDTKYFDAIWLDYEGMAYEDVESSVRRPSAWRRIR